MKNSLAFLTNELLKRNSISIDKKELQFQIESHPSYPSLHSITGVLDHFNIDNLALDIPKNEETLTQLPKVFLAQIEKTEDKEFVIAIKRGLNYQLINTSKNNETVTIKVFLEQFTGIIVAVEKTEFTDESKASTSIYNKILIVITSALVLNLFFFIKPPLFSLLFFAISILGLVLSIAIKKQEQGEETTLGNSFCSGETDKKDCNAVLASNGAKIIGDYKLSDISIIYFLGLSLSIFSLTVLQLHPSVTATISLLAVPITIYSIYYQAFVLKTWCTLCLSIVGVLWIQATISLFEVNMLNISSILWLPLTVATLCFLLVFSIYNILSPKFAELNALKKTKIKFFKFKRNFSLFDTLLQKSKPIKTVKNENFKGIVLGHREAKLQLAIVTNPFCSYCKPVHTLVEDIYKKYAEEIAIQIYFNVNPEFKNDKSTKVVTRLLELYHTKGLESCMTAMHSIYEGQDENTWLKTYEQCSDTIFYCDILEQQYTWCVENNIHFTPEILINGRSYPNEYDRSDLILFIEDLNENCCIEAEDLQLTI